jgi:hypothetical protein
MNSASNRPREAVVWIVMPEETLRRDLTIKTWLEVHVNDWIRALKQGARAQLHIRCIVLFNDAIISEEMVQAETKAALSSTFGLTEVSFEETSCLRIKYADWKDAPGCDYSSSYRDHQVYRLLLVDQQGRGYPCYGAWKAVQDGKSDLPDQIAIKKAYSSGSFRALCRECINGHPNGNWDIFPCSRYGCQVWPSIWGGSTEYPHIQFTGEDSRWCRYFEPDFEISLEQSRSRLERLIFDDDFWRDAFIEEKKPLDLFWPEDKKDGSNIIPLYTSGTNRYSFNDDTPSSLDKYPAVNYFPHHPHDLDKETLSGLRKRFLPICFLPHLRVLFDLTEDILLLSVILTDPFTNSEFNYRSLYRDGKVPLRCFVDDSWKLLWRLPNSWPKWKHVVLNLSSAIRRKKKRHAATLQEPQEYVITLSPRTSLQHSYGKENINLSEIWQCDLGNWRRRADSLGKIARQGGGDPMSPSSTVFDQVFLSEIKAEDQSVGKQVWQLVDSLSAKHSFYLAEGDNGWLPCFTDSIPDIQKVRFGCRLLNYLIWVRAMFGDALSAIETFNSTNLSRNKPSQFVAYTSAPLDPVARARVKLTLSTLLQPIEGAYAIYSEMISERDRLHLEKKDAEITAKKGAIRHYGHTMGHRVSPVVAYFERHDPTTEAAACAHLVHDMALILQAYAVQNPLEFFRLNSEKGGRFVEYDEPIDLLSLLKNEIKTISAKDVQMAHGVVYRYPQYDICTAHARIKLDLKDSVTGRPCRLHTAFFTQLLSELVINAVQHGWHDPGDENNTGKRASVRIRVDTMSLQHRPALVLTNYYSEDAKPAPSFFKAKWQPWPQDRENDGPGMALAVFRAVGAGSMMLKVTPPIPEQNEPGQVHVALLLDGLNVY